MLWHDLGVNLLNKIGNLGQCAMHIHKRQHPRATEISARTTRINFKSQRELETQISNLNVSYTREYHCNVRHTFTNMKHARATEISAQTTTINLKPPTRINLKPPREQHSQFLIMAATKH